jgi:hypothetical protein
MLLIPEIIASLFKLAIFWIGSFQKSLPIFCDEFYLFNLINVIPALLKIGYFL